jgi:hypothetical protein
MRWARKPWRRSRSLGSMENRENEQQYYLHEAALPPNFSLGLSVLARRSPSRSWADRRN